MGQIGAAFAEMGPTVIVDGDDGGIDEGMGRLNGIVGVHGEMKGATGASGTGPWRAGLAVTRTPGVNSIPHLD